MLTDIRHDTGRRRFYVTLEGETALVDYNLTDGALDVRHTYVPPSLEGRGIASELVRAAYDYARSAGLRPLATCSYAVRWLQRHPGYGGCASADYCEGSCPL